MGRRVGRRGRDAEELAFALVHEHAGELLRFARRYSLCADDAQDAYQRALEKLVRQLRSGAAPARTLSWVRTVLRHECFQVREERQRSLSREPLDADAQPAEALEDPAERVERFERLAHTAEALRSLKPQEVTALVLRAEGLSYQEICERTSWTYTRTNRAVTEGRRALRARLEQIESGEACDRWLPLLSLLADGEASARALAELRPHLRSCPGCRATLRGFHEAPRQLHELVPVAVLPVATGAGADGALRQAETVVQWVLDRAGMSAMRMQGAIDALPGSKFAAVAASTAAVAGGGAAIERAATAEAERPRAAAVSQAASAPGSAATTPIAAALPQSAAAPGPSPGGAAGEPADAGTAGEAADPAEALGPLAEFALEAPPAAEPEYTAAAVTGMGGSSGSGPDVGGAARGPGAAAGRDADDRDPADGSGATAAARNAARDATADDEANDPAPSRPSPEPAESASPAAVFTPPAQTPAPAPPSPPAAGSAPSEFGGF